MRARTDPAEFWDGIAEKYAARPLDDPENYERTLAVTQDCLEPQDHVLELGCGTGSTALKLAPAVDAYRATDISGKMIEIAQAKPGAEAIDFAQAGFDDAGRDTVYDTVLAFNLLHLVGEVESALENVAARVKPGGLFISKTMCKLDSSSPLKWRMMLLILPIFQLLGKAPALVFRSQEDYRRLFAEAGFEIESTAVHAKALPHTLIIARKRSW